MRSTGASSARRPCRGGGVLPHDLRRSFVSDLLDAGADLDAVQALAGHRRPESTVRYDRQPDTARRRGATLLHVPYSG